MRVTSSMYYKSLYQTQHSDINKKLFDVNKQIASGLKIQYAKDGVATFTETMRLDNELSALGQIKKSTESGYKVSNQTDVLLNEFETTMNRTRTLLVNAANGAHSTTSLDAIAAELRGIEQHFMTLANSSINGQYLFSGSAVDTKPINDKGEYMGNDQLMKAFLGSGVQQGFNITGAELFLGEEVLVKREVTTNVVNENLIEKNPALTTGDANNTIVSPSSTIRELMGDTDDNIDTVNAKHYFYIRGVKHDGEAINLKLAMRDDQSVDELLTQIGNAYGNTPDRDLVNVSMNLNGQIVIQDKLSGSSKLDFHMVGATDYTGGAAANVNNLDALDVGENNYMEIINGTSTSVNPNLFVKEFVKSDYTPAVGAATNIGGLIYDRTHFLREGADVTSSVPQVLKDGNAFATSSTRLSEVADLSKGTAGTLDGTVLKLTGTNLTGAAYDVDINLNAGGSNFTIGGSTYSIFDMGTPRGAVAADDMTYQQLMDVINMVVTNNLPAANTATDYDTAIQNSNYAGRTHLTYDGKISFGELNTSDTQVSIALYDDNSGDITADASVMSFNTNNALTIRDPKTDFFKTLDAMITAVEDHKLYADASSGSTRSVGIEDAITMLDDLQEHLSQSHATVGAQSNTLTLSMERTDLLEISTMTLRSSTLDTDLAEASLQLSQLTLNYEAMLSTVGRVSKLSLVNYL